MDHAFMFAEIFAQHEMDILAGLEKDDPNQDVKSIDELL